MVPFFAEQENGKTDVVAGDIGYYPGRQTLCLFYGETQPFGEVSYVAWVRSNLEGLARCGRRLLETGHLPVRLERAVPPYVSAATLVEELREFISQRWLGEPADVTKLREFTLPPMGNLPCVSTATSTCSGRASSSRCAGRRRSTATCGCRSCARSGAPPGADRSPHGQVGDARDGGADAPGRRDPARLAARHDPRVAVVIEHLMMAVNRVQAAVDAIVPGTSSTGPSSCGGRA